MQNIIIRFEDWFYQQSIQKRLIYIGFIVVFALIFALNFFFPIYCDDMLYSVVSYGESLSLVENLKEIGSFMYYYYFEWGGRVVAHIIASLLLLFSPVFQDLINSLIFCLLIYLVYRLAVGEKKYNICVFAFVAISIFYFTPSFLSSAVWITGSANYMWTTTLTLAFIYPYFNFYNGKKCSDSLLRATLFFLFGIAAGWTNENLGPILFLIIVGVLAAHYFDKKQLPRWTVLGLVGVIVGCSLMILAPGNAVRAELEGYESLFSSFDRILAQLPAIFSSYKYYMSRLIILYVVCLLGNLYFAKDVSNRKKIIIQSILFFAAANISIWITIFAPSFPPRAFMSITVLTIVSIGILYANIDFRKMLPRILNLALLAALLFYASIDYITFLKGVYFLDRATKEREVVIDELKAQGIREVAFEKIYLDYRFEYTDYTNYYKDYYDMDVLFLEKGDPKLEEYSNGK